MCTTNSITINKYQTLYQTHIISNVRMVPGVEDIVRNICELPSHVASKKGMPWNTFLMGAIYIYMVRIVYTCDLCVHNLPSNTDTKHVHGGFQAAPLG